jgi:ATP-dependent RNA helicase DeaD
MPHDWASMAQFLSPALTRVDDTSTAVQVLVVTSDAELAAAATAAAVKVVENPKINMIAATSSRRAGRMLRMRPAQVVAGSPDVLVELLHAAAIKLDGVRNVCVAWADELVGPEGLSALETLMAEVPKDAARTIVTAEITPSVEALIERYARRARRVATPADEGRPIDLEYVAVPLAARFEMLRRVLDEVDPRSAVVFARESAEDVRTVLRSLGYQGADGLVTVGHAASPETDLVILFDLPASRGELREACGAAARAIALIRPRQLVSLRALTGGGTVRPHTLSEAGARARDRDARLRAELREVLLRGQFGRDLLALEPLLDEFDGIEIAAAAASLLEAARAAAAAPAAPAPARAPRERAPRERPAPTGAMVRLFVNVGSRDAARPADLLGAFANQGGAEGSDVGRIDVRESHSIVEVSESVADSVIERVTGTPIRGRRAIVRRDEERPRERRERPPREYKERPSSEYKERPSRDYSERPKREYGDGPRRSSRGDRRTRE